MCSQIVTAVLVAFVFLAVFTHSEGSIFTPRLCDPITLDQMPPHIKKVCIALENSNQLSSALTEYIKNEAAGYSFANFKRQELSNPESKRTDVDHIFLRFGRRR